nr:ABC transporter ATP-binding protein [Aureimonas leprariae]
MAASPRNGPAAPRGVRERSRALRNLPPFLVLVWRASPPLAASAVALRLVRAFLPILLLFVGKLIIDEVVRLAGLPNRPDSLANWLESGLADRLALLVAAEFALAIADDVFGRVVSYAEGTLSERVSIAASIRLMRHAATLDLATFEDAEFQNRLERARIQTTGRIPIIGQVAGQAQDLATLASFAAGLAAYSPWLVALLAVTLVPGFLGEAHFNNEAYALAHARTAERREIDYVRQTAAGVDAAKEVKIFALGAFLVERYRHLAERFFTSSRRIAGRRAAWGALFAAFGTLGYYAAYAFIVARALAGAITIGDLTFLAGSFRRLRALLDALLTGFSATAAQALYLEDLFSFFRVEASIRRPATDLLPFPEPMRDGFRFEGVGFRYPGSERWAVRDLSFDLRAGETIALVGENGAGKTTIVKLLARLYEPTEGRITLDGRDLGEYDADALRAHVGVIFQDFVRYSLTAAENIAVGRIEARNDRPRIRTAAVESLADEVVAKLPEGYDQMVGKRFVNGVELSGGEWQKLAIARAYMRDAAVLILDEPTASLDARAEAEVFARFRDLSRGRTSVLISHRFSSARLADRILVLGEGRVEAQGTHAELLRASGRYAELFELQARGYR